MSSQGLEAWVKEEPRYTWQQVEELASRLPYQEVKDSPTIPYYTLWQRFGDVEKMPYAEESRPFTPPPGVSLENVDVYLGARGEERFSRAKPLTREMLAEWRLPIEGKLSAIHALKWYSGAAIRGGGNYVVVLAGGEGYVGHHIEIDVPDGEEARVVIYESTPAGGVSTRSFRARVGAGGSLELVFIAAHRGPAYTSGLVSMGEGAKFTGRMLLAPGAMTHVKVDHVMWGGGASTTVLASTLARGKSRSDLITNALHVGAETSSTILHRGIAARGAFAVHRGGARVTRSAQWSATNVDTSFVVADNESTGISVPILEVETGDVRDARHSTVLTRLPEDTLFYLRQRGLTPEEAVKLVEIGIAGLPGVHEALGVSVEELYLWLEGLERVSRQR